MVRAATDVFHLWLPGAVMLAAILAGGGCHRAAMPPAAAEAKAAEPARTVLCTRAAVMAWPRAVRVQGSLWGDEHAVIGAKVAGRVKHVDVDLGSAVAQDAVLAALEAEEFELQVRQAEAQLEQIRAKLGLKSEQDEKTLDTSKVPAVLQEEAQWNDARSKLKRAESLIARNVVSQEELQERRASAEVADARYRAALNTVEEDLALLAVHRAELGLARQKLADAVIRAPFAGTIAERNVAPGVYVNVGEPVVTLVRIDPLRFRAGVPELKATDIALEQEVRLSIEGAAEPLLARISRISPSLDTASRSLTIEADIPNAGSRLRTGLFAEAEIIVDPQATALAVPAAAVSEFAGVEKVWLVRDGKAAEQAVRTGRRSDKFVEILDGIAEGDVIVADAGRGRAGNVIAEFQETPTPQP